MPTSGSANSLLFLAIIKMFQWTLCSLLAQSFRQEITLLSSLCYSGLIEQKLMWGHISFPGITHWKQHPFVTAVSSLISQAGWTGLPVVQVRSSSRQPLLAVQVTCYDSASSSGISTVTMIQSCQPAQLWGNAKEGFMGCSSDFVTLIWKSRCLWNQTSQCGKREEALTYNEIGNILPFPQSIRYSMALITYRKKYQTL